MLLFSWKHRENGNGKEVKLGSSEGVILRAEFKEEKQKEDEEK
jgi:hypothetical protein